MDIVTEMDLIASATSTGATARPAPRAPRADDDLIAAGIVRVEPDPVLGAPNQALLVNGEPRLLWCSPPVSLDGVLAVAGQWMRRIETLDLCPVVSVQRRIGATDYEARANASLREYALAVALETTEPPAEDDVERARRNA